MKYLKIVCQKNMMSYKKMINGEIVERYLHIILKINDNINMHNYIDNEKNKMLQSMVVCDFMDSYFEF